MIDWAAQWFIIRSEMGQPDIATMMFQDGGKAFIREHFQHREMDGFGKIQKILQEEGLNIPAPSRLLKKPSRLMALPLLTKGLLIHPKLNHNPWKSFTEAPWSGPEEVAYWFLNHEENLALTRKAKELNLSVGFYLLSQFDQILRKNLFKNPNDASAWLCPVDVRGAFIDPAVERNWVSFLPVQFTSTVTAAYESFKSSLKQGDYWAYWELYQIGKWIGRRGMKKLAVRAHGKSFWMGSFSDLGTWNQKELSDSHASQRRWVMAPPGSPSYPIGLTTIEWCERRSLTLKIHPCICAGENPVFMAKKIISDFKRLITPTEPQRHLPIS